MTHSVQEFFIPNAVAGVYMLYGSVRRNEFLFYIGESVDVIQRVRDHARANARRKPSWTNLRSVLLLEIPEARERRFKESLFIDAAQKLGLPLINKTSWHSWEDGKLTEETERLQQALQILGYETQPRGGAA